MASAFRSTVTQRQVHITMVPAPRNLAQSRTVLKALQKFGEVATFWNLKYDYRPKALNSGRSALAIFETAQAASNAINASPIAVPIPESSISPDEPFPTNSAPESEEAEPTSSAPRITCTINPSEHDHNVSIRQNPYHRQFHLSKTWYELQDLSRSSGPRSVPLVQYADCFTRRKGRVPMRIQGMWLRESEENGAMSLMKLWKRGMEKEREGERKRVDADANPKAGFAGEGEAPIA
ncbi:hypothetical protein CPC735_069620 [Coccidioides posadasii C735 delta SOWgp]|uniref:Uncharacterized protein n=1 Tax=Coccidioides posadasii (strain C735) TaxID=222929 RepID=C5P0S2_COCP7|nr:hypothetical protein CPC735_069620 [Coccidioides posadasii C735 delta SOWgp]EER29280.1 hypothetical protein CPC735_069620 [Coccidioides posadasii C735 delta SOWgp]|eukprot:XP_003071425.1 hypothetical protein CPC735_069620 [Coccidioides posadasii C735 delta SOWgp]